MGDGGIVVQYIARDKLSAAASGAIGNSGVVAVILKEEEEKVNFFSVGEWTGA